MSDSSAIRIVHPSQFDKGTLQTPGSEREAAIAPQLGIQSMMWGGLFEVKPGARTGIHHHGVCGGRRFHSRSSVLAPHGNQSVEFAIVPMGGGEEHVDADRGQSSRGYVAIVLRRPERGRRLGV